MDNQGILSNINTFFKNNNLAYAYLIKKINLKRMIAN